MKHQEPLVFQLNMPRKTRQKELKMTYEKIGKHRSGYAVGLWYWEGKTLIKLLGITILSVKKENAGSARNMLYLSLFLILMVETTVILISPALFVPIFIATGLLGIRVVSGVSEALTVDPGNYGSPPMRGRIKIGW